MEGERERDKETRKERRVDGYKCKLIEEKRNEVKNETRIREKESEGNVLSA